MRSSTSKPIAALGAICALAIATAGCGSSVPGDAVASVAGNSITTQAYKHWMFVAAKGNTEGATNAPVIVPTDPPDFAACVSQVRKQIPTLAKISDKTVATDCAQLFTSLNDQVLDFLIKSYWYQAEAHKQHITLTPAQVASALAAAKKSTFPTAAQFVAFLKSTGQTAADITFRVRVNQLYTKLLARYEKKATPAAISAYYASHQSQFSTPQTRNLRLVRTNSQSQALAAKAALQSGQSWKAVAKKYSVDAVTKDTGGVLNGVTKGEEEHALDVAAFAAAANRLSGPIHGTFGWYVFEVTKITPATHQSMAAATAEIKQLLTSQYQTAAETDLNDAVKKDFGSQTTCRAAFSMSDCHGYTAPKAAATTTSAPASTTGSASASSSAASSTSTTSAASSTASTKSKT